MFNGKNRAITFSYDDGTTQDIRLVEIFNKYGLKGTFNLNSECLGKEGALLCDEWINVNKVDSKKRKNYTDISLTKALLI